MERECDKKSLGGLELEGRLTGDLMRLKRRENHLAKTWTV